MIDKDTIKKLRAVAEERGHKFEDGYLEAAENIWKHLPDTDDKAERLIRCMRNICAQGRAA